MFFILFFFLSAPAFHGICDEKEVVHIKAGTMSGQTGRPEVVARASTPAARASASSAPRTGGAAPGASGPRKK